MATLPIKGNGRQPLEVAYVDIGFADLISGTAVNALELPPNAVVTGGDIVVNTAWNSATSDVATVGDATVANRYYASASIAATGRNALVATGFIATSTQRYVTVTWTGVGAVPTAGSLRLRVDYFVKTRSQWAQG